MNSSMPEMAVGPSSVMDYAAAIQRTGAGQFISRFSPEGQRAFASFYGAPFFALSRLAPEAIEALGANLLLISADPGIADDGGRWLSLFAKVHKPNQKFNLTVCVTGKPRTGKAPKPLLFQQPQQVLLKDWKKHLEALDEPPSVIIFQPWSLEDLESGTDIFSRHAVGSKVLVSCTTLPDVLIARALMAARGFDPGEILDFPASEKEVQHCAPGGWWFSVSVPPFESLRLADNSIDALRLAHRAYIGHQAPARNSYERAEIAAIYATRSLEQVADEQSVETVRLLPNGGICLANGRFFTRSAHSESSRFTWDEEGVLSAELLASVPKKHLAHTDHEDRLNVMLWLGQAVFGEQQVSGSVSADDLLSNEDELLSDEVQDPSETVLSEAQTTPEGLAVAMAANSPESARDPATKAREAPIRPRLSRSAGTVNVLALAAMLGKPGGGSDKSFESAKTDVLRWLFNKGFKTLDADSNQHAEHADGEVTIETDGQGLWAMRFDDRRSMAEGAIWRVEVTLLGMGSPAMSVRMAQVRSTEQAPPPIASGVPGVVSKVAQRIGLQDAGVALVDSAKHLNGGKDGVWISKLLLNPHRGQPVIVISGNVDGSADRLAKRLVGVAHVVRIDKPISDGLTRNFGRDRSVFGNAVRLYRPGFDTDADPFQHPLWVLKGPVLPKWLADELFEHACSISLEVGDIEERAPSFHSIRNLLAEGRLASSEQRLIELRRQTESITSTAEEKIGRLQAINEELEATLAEQKARNGYLAEQLRQADQELQATRLERAAALEEVRQLRFKLSNQWNEVETGYSENDDHVEYPDSWDELETWVEVYGRERLVLHPKAAKAARESPFRDIPLAYKAMDYLVRYYIPMRTRSAEDTDAYLRSKQALAALGLEESDVGTADEIKRYKKEYRRQYDGREVTLDRHLKRGVGFGGDYQFRLYFHYDDAAQKVLVGHMPTHLTNRLSHNG